VLLWLWVIELPTVLYCPLKLKPPVFCTLMVIDNAVMAPVLLNFTPSSSKKGWLELITVDTVTPPLPVPAAVTVRAVVVVWLRVPLVPVTVTLVVPVVAVLEAVKVTVLVPVVEVGLKLAVTPEGKPLALRATLPVNPPEGVTVNVLVPVAPWVTVALVADREKSGVCATVTFRLTVVVWVSDPLVPVTVTVAAPVVAVLEAVKVTVLVPVVDAGLKLAVTPEGKPLALNATLPVNPPAGVTVTLSVPELPWVIEIAAVVAAREKSGLGGALTVTLIAVVAESVPLAPVIVTDAVPTVAVPDAENVTVLVPAVDAGLKEAVTPAGNPLALNVTLPLKPPLGVTEMVSVADPPRFKASVDELTDRENPGVGGPLFGSP